MVNLNLCGSCDAGLPMSCTCETVDTVYIATNIERWLKARRDEYGSNVQLYSATEVARWTAIDNLLNEARDALVEGRWPWDRRDDDE